MIKSVLIIDDEQAQAEGIAKAFSSKRPDYIVNFAFDEKKILIDIENIFFNVAIVDLRMDKFSINGFNIIKKIIEVNPFAHIIIVSAFTGEYIKELQSILPTGKIQAIIEKTDFDTFMSKILKFSDEIVDEFDSNLLLNSKALAKIYAHAKLEKDVFKKGKIFEDFTVLLFSSMGFKHIYSRLKDKSLNEIDLVLRNDIGDSFIQRFGEYIFIECKNKPDGSVNKNDLIIFLSKVKNSNGLCKFGIILTTGYITWNTYYEAMRSSSGEEKIIFISNPEIEKILKSKNYLDELKMIIDSQVKDN